MASTDEKNTINITTTPSTSIITAMSGALKPPMKMLSNADLAEVCRKIGAPPSRCAIEPPSVSNGTIPPPPANDVPSGLYKEVISARKRAQYNYYFTATLYNTCIVLQLLLGASLTALGSSTNTTSHGLSITILAAANTVNAGIIALLHNSGLPNRIKQDWNEFAKVEAYLEEMIYTGLVLDTENKIDAVAKCWDLFAAAKATIEKNKPSVYTSAPSATATSTSPPA